MVFNKKYAIDWDSLKSEYMQGNMTLNELRLKHNINGQANFYKQVNSRKFEEARQKIRTKAVQKIENNQIKRYAKEWDNQMSLWQNVESMAQKIMSRKRETLEPDELSSLSTAIEKALKSQRLILGESTENNANVNVHAALADLLEKEGDDTTLPK